MYEFDCMLSTQKYKVLGFYINVSDEVFFDLYDKYLQKVGNDKDIKRKITRLKSAFKNLLKYTLKPTLQNKMYYQFGMSDLDNMREESKRESVDIYPYIIEKFGYIDKKTISVNDYCELYKKLLENG